MESAQERGHAVFEQQVHEGGAAEDATAWMPQKLAVEVQ